MKKKHLPIAIFLVACAALSAHPTSPSAEEEISHLLNYLENSGCRFYRNGAWYDAQEARAHLDRKYRHFPGAERPGAADRFIAEVASKSSMSGEAYRVECQGAAAVESASWFREELMRYRAGEKARR